MGRAIRAILGPGLGLGLALSVAGCAALPWHRPAPEPAPETPAVPSPRPKPRPALAPSPVSPGTQRQLGTTVASLGSPAQPGLWLRTPLVAAETPGRVALGGKSLAVTLLPLPGPKGGGSQLSMAAYRALGLPLTALPQLAVSAP